jgi:hypothetical protein
MRENLTSGLKWRGRGPAEKVEGRELAKGNVAE